MFLDIKTAYFLLGLFYIVMPLSVYLYLQEHRTTPVKLWCLGGLLNGLGFLMISFRPALQGHVPELFTFTLVNVLIITGYSIRIQSLRLEMKCAFPMPIMVAFLTLYGIFYQLFVILGKFEYRVLFGLAAIAVMTFTLSLSVRSYLRYFAINRMSYLGLTYFLLGLTVSVKFILLLLGLDDPNLLKSSLINTVMTMTGLFAVVYSNIGYVGVVLAKVQNEYKISLSKNIEMASILEKRNSMIQDLMRVQAFSVVGTYGSTVVHEVLQPLTAMRFALENLKMHVLKISEDKTTQERIEAVDSSATRAISVIENLRNFIVEREVQVVAVPLNSILREVLEITAGRAKALGVQTVLKMNDEISVMADEHQLQRVLFNLVNNALDAIEKNLDSSTDKRILVDTKYAQQKQFVVIKVVDTGIGLQTKDQAEIFEWLSTSSNKGMGIGLALSRMLVESWRGHISAYPADPKVDGLSGAVFELKLRNAG